MNIATYETSQTVEPTSEAVVSLAGQTALSPELPMNSDHPHYADWLEYVQDQPVQGC